MSRLNKPKLFRGKKISILPRVGRGGNDKMPHIGNFDELYNYVIENSTPCNNGCLLWNGSYNYGGNGTPQITLRDNGNLTITRTMRQAFNIALVGLDTSGTYKQIPPPSCGYCDCVHPDHQSFVCE